MSRGLRKDSAHADRQTIVEARRHGHYPVAPGPRGRFATRSQTIPSESRARLWIAIRSDSLDGQSSWIACATDCPHGVNVLVDRSLELTWRHGRQAERGSPLGSTA